MAYISRTYEKDPWSGPYPDKAGEFCGNQLRSELELDPDGVVLARFSFGEEREGKSWDRPYRPIRAGRPSSCPTGTSDEMAAKGFVGLYLIGDIPDTVGTTLSVETDVLTEEVVSGLRPPVKPFVPGVPMYPPGHWI